MTPRSWFLSLIHIYTCKVMLFNDYYDEEQYTSSAHPGLIRMGDVNGDDIIDDEDLEELLDAIHAEESGVNAMEMCIRDRRK